MQQQCKLHCILLCEQLEQTFSLVLGWCCLVFSSCCICCTLSALPLKRSVKAGKTWPSQWVPPAYLGTPTCKFVILSLTFHHLSIVCKVKTFAYSKNQKNAQLLQINNPFHFWTAVVDESDLTPNVWLHSSVGKATHRQRGGHRFESCRSADFFQASSIQLLKLENLLEWSFFTFIYNCSSKMNYFIYFTLFHSSREIWTQ